MVTSVPEKGRSATPDYLVYVHLCLVSRSHSGNLKMGDPTNVWDLPITVWTETFAVLNFRAFRGSVAICEKYNPRKSALS